MDVVFMELHSSGQLVIFMLDAVVEVDFAQIVYFIVSTVILQLEEDVPLVDRQEADHVV